MIFFYTMLKKKERLLDHYLCLLYIYGIQFPSKLPNKQSGRYSSQDGQYVVDEVFIRMEDFRLEKHEEYPKHTDGKQCDNRNV